MTPIDRPPNGHTPAWPQCGLGTRALPRAAGASRLADAQTALGRHDHFLSLGDPTTFRIPATIRSSTDPSPDSDLRAFSTSSQRQRTQTRGQLQRPRKHTAPDHLVDRGFAAVEFVGERCAREIGGDALGAQCRSPRPTKTRASVPTGDQSFRKISRRRARQVS